MEGVETRDANDLLLLIPFDERKRRRKVQDEDGG